MPKCEYCGELYDAVEGQPPSGGCYGVVGASEECPFPERKDRAWRIGLALVRDLSDRRGIKHEIDACDYEVQAEIIETLGKIAEREYPEP